MFHKNNKYVSNILKYLHTFEALTYLLQEAWRGIMLLLLSIAVVNGNIGVQAILKLMMLGRALSPRNKFKLCHLSIRLLHFKVPSYLIISNTHISLFVFFHSPYADIIFIEIVDKFDSFLKKISSKYTLMPFMSTNLRSNLTLDSENTETNHQ